VTLTCSLLQHRDLINFDCNIAK